MGKNARLNTEKSVRPSMKLSMSRNARPSMRQSTRKNAQQHTRINVKLSMRPYARKLPLHHMDPQLVKENMAHPKLLQKDMELQLLQNVHNRKSKSAQRFQDNNANKYPNKYPNKSQNKNASKLNVKSAAKSHDKFQKQSMKIVVSRY